MCIFTQKQSGIGFKVDALFGHFAYLHSLNTVVELHTNIVLIHFGSQPISTALFEPRKQGFTGNRTAPPAIMHCVCSKITDCGSRTGGIENVWSCC